ncbi:MAG: hypothetical protein HeimC3_41890 [Candidatus Heimdallarchaeota archaeon LC_3]|nr:MAG: hypothetical protein HeimC3_41890 [Candidatus Heimdallarchaeota archaeon LC_3]
MRKKIFQEILERYNKETSIPKTIIDLLEKTWMNNETVTKKDLINSIKIEVEKND